jgi:FkbM family methyltransferase
MNNPTPKFVEGLDKFPFISEDDVPILTSDTPLGAIKFWGYGETSEFRVRTLLTKEPETINWINSFDKESTFWDIGANIGIYSLYASLKAGTKVVSFEPSSFNYFLLNKNIYLNASDSNVDSYNIAFSNTNCLDHLHLGSVDSAGAANSFAVKKDGYGTDMDIVFRQACIGFTIDDFIRNYDLSTPNYIKIDVDGIEKLILKGAEKTLMDLSLKSLLIEVNEKKVSETNSICLFMKRCGFSKVIKRHPPDFDDYYYKPFFNYVFYRE